MGNIEGLRSVLSMISVSMDVDNNGPFTNSTALDWMLELREPLYVGGVYDLSDLPPALAGASG